MFTVGEPFEDIAVCVILHLLMADAQLPRSKLSARDAKLNRLACAPLEEIYISENINSALRLHDSEKK